MKQTKIKIQGRAVVEMQSEAKRLLKEFESYVEDLELFAKPTFWKAVNQKEGPAHKSIHEYAKKMGL